MIGAESISKDFAEKMQENLKSAENLEKQQKDIES